LTDVQSSCGVSGIRDLRAGVLIGEGSVKLCDTACTSAMATLELHATECTAAELDSHISVTKKDLNVSALARASCFPPSQACFRVMQDLIQFESTRTGQACIGDMEQFTSGSLSDSVAQQQVRDARAFGSARHTPSTFVIACTCLSCTVTNATGLVCAIACAHARGFHAHTHAHSHTHTHTHTRTHTHTHAHTRTRTHTSLLTALSFSSIAASSSHRTRRSALVRA
jgi:hypothetical protein